MNYHIARTFDEYQVNILTLVDEAELALNDGARSSFATLTKIYLELDRSLPAYQHFKHLSIFDPMIDSITDSRLFALELKVDCVRLGIEYRAFVQFWRSCDVNVDWPKCRLMARSIHRSIKVGLSRERELIRHAKQHQDSATRVDKLTISDPGVVLTF